jgi:hypothetical protein
MRQVALLTLNSTGMSRRQKAGKPYEIKLSSLSVAPIQGESRAILVR